MVVDDRFEHLRVAIVEDRKFGGTCVNYGCIPSKMLSYTAELTDSIAVANTFGIDAELHELRWPQVRDRVFGRTDAVSTEGERGRRAADFVDVYSGHARFTGDRQLAVATAEESSSSAPTGSSSQPVAVPRCRRRSPSRVCPSKPPTP